MAKKLLVATEKPFAAAAVNNIKKACENAGYEFVALENYKEKEELIEAVKNVDALIVRSDKVTADVAENAENLKIVVRAGAGYDNVDLEACSKKGITVMNTPGQNSNAVAELAFGMMLYTARNQFNGKAGTELFGKTVGIHAYGNVGKNVARIAKGFNMDVIAFDPFVDDEIMKKDGVNPVKTVEELYRKSDYISLHLPSVPATRKFVNYDLMKEMKENAALINTARKEVVCEESMIKLFEERKDLKYASDVAPNEAEKMKELFGNRVYFTPKKMGAQTAEANINAGTAAANQIVNFFEKGDLTFKVNK
ncbi:MAG: 3-phosphoglycerate dehydrogenase [Candidatus Cloacimonadota bacterium]|nr:MAG: 3-phosphoglycerate dehydrogenase [Candidatus Cloacimonadota bacterium]